jgi:hypothetical protein
VAIKSKTPPANPHNPWAQVICAGCNEPFYLIQSLASTCKTCSPACKQRARGLRWEQITCLQCATVRRMRKTNPPAKFCSKSCARRNSKGINHARWVEERERKCLNCSVLVPKYVQRPSGRLTGRLNYSERKFCSDDCRIAHRRNNPLPTDAAIGTISKYKDGYKMIKLIGRGWVPEHRHVMEQTLNRLLTKEEIVHHRYGDPSDNEPDHLMVTSKSEHQQIHYRAERAGLLEMWIHPIEGVEV